VATILQFIRVDTFVFDDSATRAMGEAFDAACAELHDHNLSELVREIIAERIIEAAKWGERDPTRLCSIAIAAISGERKINNPEHWYSCAEEARAIAERLKIADARFMMLEIASNFEHRAERAERGVADKAMGKSA